MKDPYRVYEIDELSKFGAKKHTTTATVSVEKSDAAKLVYMPEQQRAVLELLIRDKMASLAAEKETQETLELMGDIVRCIAAGKYSCLKTDSGLTHKLGYE
jgi:hypothetical protein